MMPDTTTPDAVIVYLATERVTCAHCGGVIEPERFLYEYRQAVFCCAACLTRRGQRCDFCGKQTDCRDYERQTMPTTGQWCEDCYARWLAVFAIYPMAFGGMLATGWGDDE